MNWFDQNILGTVITKLDQILKNQTKIMASQDQEAIDLEAVATQLKNVATQQGSVLTGIQALEQALANAGGTTPAVDQALADLKTAAQGAADASQAAANALPAPPNPSGP